MNKEINVLSMFRNKNKLSYFSIRQFSDKVREYDSSIRINFHIIWDDNQELNGLDKQYENLIDEEFGKNIICYSKNDLKLYCKKYYNVNESLLEKFDNFRFLCPNCHSQTIGYNGSMGVTDLTDINRYYRDYRVRKQNSKI
jgi:hypothetical protein